MKRIATLFFQAVIVALGVGALALLLWEPHLEGRNAHATLSEIYLKDPFLAYVYAASIFFFVALYQVFKLLGFIRQDDMFSQRSVKALRIIKYCGFTLAILIAAPVIYLFIALRGQDDIAGGVAVGLFIVFVSGITAAVAAASEKMLRGAVKRKAADLSLRIT